MSTPSPSSPPLSPPSTSSPKPDPLATTSAVTAAVKKSQPMPWTHQETLHLIQAYQEKWYSLKRGQLKASQWEEVAVTVTARCGYDFSHPAKTATQCRHKMEKLRKRFRVEKQRFGANSSWHYYHLMDSLERGPLPISARPLALLPFSEEDTLGYNYDEQNNEDDDEEDDERYSKSRSINYILRRPSIVNRFAGSGGGFSGFRQTPEKKRKVENDEEDEEDDRGRGRRAGSNLAAEIRGFAERVMGVERRKMEMIRETERRRMEMENKRIQMIMESQRKVIDMIEKAFGLSQENLKIEQQA